MDERENSVWSAPPERSTRQRRYPGRRSARQERSVKDRSAMPERSVTPERSETAHKPANGIRRISAYKSCRLRNSKKKIKKKHIKRS